jgi:hypothetical protein
VRCQRNESSSRRVQGAKCDGEVHPPFSTLPFPQHRISITPHLRAMKAGTHKYKYCQFKKDWIQAHHAASRVLKAMLEYTPTLAISTFFTTSHLHHFRTYALRKRVLRSISYVNFRDIQQELIMPRPTRGRQGQSIHLPLPPLPFLPDLIRITPHPHAFKLGIQKHHIRQFERFSTKIRCTASLAQCVRPRRR